jgi:hypothetical protein
MKHSGYATRALKAGDARYARVFDRLGYYRTKDEQPELVQVEKVADPLDHDGDGRKGGSPRPEGSDELAELRSEYQEKFGKRPFMGWGAEKLREMIAGADQG